MKPFAPRLLWLLLGLPLVEVYLLIEIGARIGGFLTVFLVVSTAALGLQLIRYQGLSTFLKVQASLKRGELPALELLEGVVLLVAGAFLLTPGFLSDALGFLALMPVLRRRVLSYALAKGVIRQPRGPASPTGPRTIEGEFSRQDD